MNLPTIMRTTQESLKTVPQCYREGARPGRRQVAHHPHGGAARLRGRRGHGLHPVRGPHSGRDGGAAVYGGLCPRAVRHAGRDAGKRSGATLSVALYVYAKEQGEFDVAFAIAAILMALALLINLAATLAARYFKRRRTHDAYDLCQRSEPVVRPDPGAAPCHHGSVQPNTITALIGPSGCGKSTFLKTLNRMNDLVPGVKITGQVLYNDRTSSPLRGREPAAPGGGHGVPEAQPVPHERL